MTIDSGGKPWKTKSKPYTAEMGLRSRKTRAKEVGGKDGEKVEREDSEEEVRAREVSDGATEEEDDVEEMEGVKQERDSD